MALNQNEDEKLSAFLEGFSSPLLHIPPASPSNPWVFWSQDEASPNHSSSVDVPTLRLSDNIKSAFSEFYCHECDFIMYQLWAPVKIDGRRLLSTSAQPFAITQLDNNNLKKYRLHSMEYRYNIDDVNMQLCNIDYEEEDPKILSGGPASAFLNRLPELVVLKHHGESPLARYASECGLEMSFMIPICDTSQPSSCIAVLEASATHNYDFVYALQHMKIELENAGLGIISDVQERIPYKAINGLEPVKKKIEAALHSIIDVVRLDLAQVWIACEDANHVPFSSSLETKPMLALKLTDYFSEELDELFDYYHTCDLVSLKAGLEPVVKTLQDYEPRFCKNLGNLGNATLISRSTKEFLIEISVLIICLRSIDTGDFSYAFEFMWSSKLNYVIMLETLLITLNRHLPGFKFASGAELCDKLHIIDVENSTETETKFLSIFQGSRVSPMSDALEKGKKPMLVDHTTHSERKYKTAPILVNQEQIEQQFGKTMKEAAENLKGGGDESNVIDVEKSIDSEIKTFKIFQGSEGSPMSGELKKGKKHKTARIELSQEVIEQQFGNTQTLAARNLKVHLSTLKRKCKEYRIFEWQGPVKRKANDSCNYQSNRNQEDNGAIQEPSVVNRNENTVTIRAKYGADTIKFTIKISEATLVTVEMEISKRFKMTLGTFKLKYQDEVEWILLTCDEDMSDCIKSMNNVRLLVILAT